jgi:hypothetical protein
MLVELDADLNHPPSRTGGCKLTRSEVHGLVKELVLMGNDNKIAPGLRVDWNFEPIKLESTCMHLVNPLTPPPLQDASVCYGFLTNTINGNPRTLTCDWYHSNIVGRGPNEDYAYLRAPGDWDYHDDECIVNLYFIGNCLDRALDPTSAPQGITYSASPSPSILINDKAFTDVAGAANSMELFLHKVVQHEAVCHELTGGWGHSPVTYPPCPDDLCLDGRDVDQLRTDHACYGTSDPGKVPSAVQMQIWDRTLGCGDVP